MADLNERQRERRSLGPDADREHARALRDKVDELERRAARLESERDALWAQLPNLLAPDTPDGQDDADNVELRRWGDPPAFSFEPKPHDLLGARLGILDLERGAVVGGAGFYYWRGDGARLAWGLFSLALDFLVKRGFVPMLTPIVARERTLFGTGYLPFFADQIYRLEGVDLSLIGTSEQTLVGYHADELLPAEGLPLLYTAMSPCFRTEAGSGGRAARGAFRVHQFHKVEQIVFCRPDDSERWHLHCLESEELFMQRLGIPYRVVRVCLGDLGAPAYKKYDLEGWFAGFGQYRETHSNTNLLDYQTRRLNARYKDGKRTVFPHTISATMITDRALLAILENNQQADGSVIVPAALRPYVDGQERLTAPAR
jgi:seryl-tRNA synthetase